ncbi:MAG: sugar porter family MFS transporter, partial [Pseudomonadota bacterium]
AVISGVEPYITPQCDLNDGWVGAIVSAPTFAAIIAALTVTPLADHVGRKRVMTFLAALYSVSAFASAIAPTPMMVLVARFIGGFAFGTLMLAPIYIAELAPARLRGRMVSVNQFNIVIGFSLAYFANYFIQQLSQSDSSLAVSLDLERTAWRFMLGLEALPAVLYFLFMLIVPESPRWLALNGREVAARGVLSRVAPAESIDALIADIRASAHADTQTLGEKIRELGSPRLRLVLIVGLLAAVAQQSSGINAVFFYAPTIFEQSGVGTDAAFAQAAYIGVVNVVFTIVAMLLIDTLGRRPLMLAGLLGIASSMFLSAWGFHSDNPTLVLVGIMSFVGSFAFSLGPVMWVLFSEIFPNHVRGVCMAIMATVNSSVSWVVQFIFPTELARLGPVWTMAIFGLTAVVFFVLLAWLMPETRGRSLEELEIELTAGAG